MSIDVALAGLATTLERFTFAYLAAVGSGERAHIVAVSTVFDGVTLRIGKPGRTTGRNIGEQPAVTLVWPPSSPAGH